MCKLVHENLKTKHSAEYYYILFLRVLFIFFMQDKGLKIANDILM